MRILILVLGLLVFYSCSNSDDSKSNENVTVGFYLTDAPAKQGYKAVHIDIQSISYSLEQDNWINIPIKSSVIELLQFSNGKDSLLSNVMLEAGIKVQQIRLVLGDNNTLTLNDGTVVPLKVPSGQTSGLKLNVQSVPDIQSGYRVIIDFNAAQSIVSKGNGEYSLKPVIRAYIEANTSSVYGNLTPSDEMVRVFTLNASGDTISTLSDTLQNNYFKLHGLFSGTYKIEVQDLATGQFSVLKDNVNVIGGTNVNLGIVPIP